ncbi:MAG: histidine triad nucleotide-binding protein [Planctomycetes bacterium]|nr:histidine triad nucleotide-binding protein [Planctomycetota bacterium]
MRCRVALPGSPRDGASAGGKGLSRGRSALLSASVGASRRPSPAALTYDPSNVFARILRREIPAQVLHEDEHCLAFRDVAPQAPLHFLVIPKRPLARLADAGGDDGAVLGHLLLTAAAVARQQGFGDAFRTVLNSGAGAGQTVFHLHVHVLAGRPLAWPPG